MLLNARSTLFAAHEHPSTGPGLFLQVGMTHSEASGSSAAAAAEGKEAATAAASLGIDATLGCRYLESQVAQSNRPLKVSHNYRPLAFQAGLNMGLWVVV